MYKIRLQFPPKVATALASFIESSLNFIKDSPSFEPFIPGDDPLIASAWTEDLNAYLREDLLSTQALCAEIDSNTTEIELTSAEADSLIRMCSAIRLKIHENALGGISDCDLEEGNVEMEGLSASEKNAFASYIFLSNIQEIVISAIQQLPSD